MDNHKKIFSEILEESNIPPLKKTFLFEKTYEIDFKLYEEKSRHYRVEFVVEENWKAAVRNDLKKFKKVLTSSIKKKLICNSVKLEVTGKKPNEMTQKEKYELALKNLREAKENSKMLLEQKKLEKKEISSTWQAVIDNHKKIKEGYIYILSNPRIAGTYKIGFVKEDVFKRAYSLKIETGLYRDFVIEKTWKTKNPYEVEQKIFKSLEMQKNEKGEYDSSLGKCYRTSRFLNGKTFNEFVEGESLKFFCERIEEFIKD